MLLSCIAFIFVCMSPLNKENDNDVTNKTINQLKWKKNDVNVRTCIDYVSYSNFWLMLLEHQADMLKGLTIPK